MAKITTNELFQEWKDMNTKLQSQIDKQGEIITKQQTLLERLDSPNDTQLTGSIDEYELPVRIDSNVEVINIFKGVEIPPGGTVRLDPPIDIHKFSDILIQFRSGGHPNGFVSYQIDSLWHQADKGGAAFTQNIIDESDKASNVSSEWTPVMGVKTTISVKNRMEEEKSFTDLTVIGRRL